MASQSEKDIFEYLESTMQDVELPTLPDDELEYHVVHAIDPIIGAKTIQLYAESQSPDAQDHIINKYNDLLSYTFTAEYINRPVNVMINQPYGTPDLNRLADMYEVINEYNRVGEVMVGGKMSFFERHVYTDPETNITRPILSLRLHSGAFKRQDNEDGTIVPIRNYVTIPVTAFNDYRIQDRRSLGDYS